MTPVNSSLHDDQEKIVFQLKRPHSIWLPWGPFLVSLSMLAAGILLGVYSDAHDMHAELLVFVGISTLIGAIYQVSILNQAPAIELEPIMIRLTDWPRGQPRRLSARVREW